MTLLKWLGFALVAISVGVLPFTIWISNDWGLVSAAIGLVGCALLGIALRARREETAAGAPGSAEAADSEGPDRGHGGAPGR